MKLPRQILLLKPIWNNGSVTFKVTYPTPALFDHHQINRLADLAGYRRTDASWTPPTTRWGISELASALSRIGIKLEYKREPLDAPFDLQRLSLKPETRSQLEGLLSFELYHLSGWAPVQAEGILDGGYFFFRARGSYWRFEWGGSENGTRSPRLWHEEAWPIVTGFEGGYLTDEEAICCVLKSGREFRTGDHRRFGPDDPDYERTIIEGWALGALSLRIAAVRLDISGGALVHKGRAYDIELPYSVERELQWLNAKRKIVHRLRWRSDTCVSLGSKDETERDA